MESRPPDKMRMKLNTTRTVWSSKIARVVIDDKSRLGFGLDCRFLPYFVTASHRVAHEDAFSNVLL